MSNLDITDAQAYGHDAERSVNTLASELEQLAARLRSIAQPLARGDGTASRVAAQIVNEYTQGVGAVGPRLWSVVRNAADADRAAGKKD